MSTSLREEVDHVPTIPASILQTVRHQTQGPNSSKKPTPTTKLPPLSILTSSTQGGTPSTNIWHHPGQRQKFKHLVEQTQCICGAGGRDISFLYDAAKQEQKPASTANDESTPHTLIPQEFHVVKNSGVLGLLLHDDRYAVNLENHEKHLTVFPSLKPSGRQEVIALKSTLQQLIDRSGLCNVDTDLSGPTQMHNLVTLIQKEQEIYNICFHELIRQVSVGCVERGTLLAEIRDCYANLLNRIPFQVKSLHDEVLAQRALDRKITTELSRFKNLMSSLTSELGELKEQNELAGEEIEVTKTGLSMAISESEKNANLLLEYSELYELQRKRLEDHIVILTQEKDLWEHTSYQLALKVAKKRQLKTIQRIQLSGKSWEKLGTHFTILMADKNTKDLCIVQEEVLNWRKQLVDFTEKLFKVEEFLKIELLAVEEDMQKWFEKLSDPNMSAIQMALDGSFFNNLSQAISSWLHSLNTLSEIFSGETLLNRQEHLLQIEQSMKKWSEISVSIVQHHVRPSMDKRKGKRSHDSLEERTDVYESLANGQDEQLQHSPSVHSLEGVNAVLADVKVYGKDLSIRTSGENGVAVSFVHLITPMEAWETKFGLILSSDSRFLIDSERAKLISQMAKWLKIIREMSETVSKNTEVSSKTSTDSVSNSTLPSSPRPMDVNVISHNVDKWCSLFSRAVQVEDGQVIDQVTETHSSLVKWMADVLLYLSSSDVDDNDDLLSDTSRSTTPASTTPKPNTPFKRTSVTPSNKKRIAHSSKADSMNDIFELKSSCKYLCEHLDRFTKEIFNNCSLVLEETINNATSSKTNLEMEGEKEELQVFRDEAANWIRLSSVLMDTSVTEHYTMMKEAQKKKEKEQLLEVEDAEITENDDDEGSEHDDDDDDEQHEYSSKEKEEFLQTVMTIDYDDNVSEIDNTVRQKTSTTFHQEQQDNTVVSLEKLGLSSEADLPEGRGALSKDTEKLILELKELEEKLAKTEKCVQNEKNRADTAEERLKKTEEEMNLVSEKLKQTQKELDQLQPVEKSKKTSKSQQRPKDKDKRKAS